MLKKHLPGNDEDIAFAVHANAVGELQIAVDVHRSHRGARRHERDDVSVSKLADHLHHGQTRFHQRHFGVGPLNRDAVAPRETSPDAGLPAEAGKYLALGRENPRRLQDNVPYDFSFKHGASSLYCFELAALCYKKLSIPTFNVKKMFGLISKKDVYLA